LRECGHSADTHPKSETERESTDGKRTDEAVIAIGKQG
jgi:hypothetical protein